MSINGLSPSNRMRFSGMATGMDTEAMVEKMIMADKMKIDKIDQDKQYVNWRQEAYIDIISDLRKLQDTFLSLSASDETSVMRSSSYAAGKVTSSNSSIATVRTTAEAQMGEYKIKVSQKAKTAKIAGESLNLSGDISGSLIEGNWKDKSITFNIGGKDMAITLGSVKDELNNVTVESIAKAINTAIDVIPDNDANAELKGKIKVSANGNSLQFNSLTSEKIKIVPTEAPDIAIGELKSLENKTINPDSTTTLFDLGLAKDSTSTIKIKLNNADSVDIEFKDTDTIKSVLEKINSAKVGSGDEAPLLSNYINVRFSELDNKLSIETKNEGLSTTIQIEDGTDGDKFRDLFGLGTDAKGKDAEVEITTPDGTTVPVVKSSNNFQIDGIIYDINGESTTEEVSIKIEADASETVDKIAKFLEEYNKVVAKVNKSLSEKKDLNWKPLTAEQKKDMSKEDIERWEKKCKQGVLKGEHELQSVVDAMRSAFMSEVEKSGLTLKDLGLFTSKNTKDPEKRGQIVFIDDKFNENVSVGKEKLKNMLETRGDQVRYLFTNSDKDSMGIFKKLDKIVDDYTRKDGPLVKKAGYKDSRYLVNNTLSKRVKEKEKLIYEMQKKMYKKQDSYYSMFAKLEKAMNDMNAQSSWLASQMGGV